MDTLDISDPTWLDDFLAEDLKASETKVDSVTPFPYTSSASLETSSNFFPRTSFLESRQISSVEHESLLKKFKFLKGKKKLSIPKLSEMFGISRASLQRFSSGKDKNFVYIGLIRNWVFHPSNSEELRCFETNERNERLNLLEPTSNATRMHPLHPSDLVYIKREIPFSRSETINHYGTKNDNKHQVVKVNTIPLKKDYRVFKEQEHQYQYMPISKSRVAANKLGSLPPKRPFDNRSWNSTGSLEVLSQMLKRDTNKLLHKGIDSAIQEYLDQSKVLRDKIKSDTGVRENDYFYTKQSKLLLNRLTTICGDDVVNRATSVLSGLENKRNFARDPLSAKRLAEWTRTWNHACSCKNVDCEYPNCVKIKPAVRHQLQLKDERRRMGNQNVSCSIPNCEHCLLYVKLKKFSTTTQNYTNKPQVQSVRQNSPNPATFGPHIKNIFHSHCYRSRNFSHQQSKFEAQGKQEKCHTYKSGFQHRYSSSHNQQHQFRNNEHRYSSRHKPHNSQQGSTQIFNQENNVTNNIQNTNRTSVRYNTYNIHTNPVINTEKVDVEDMSVVAEMLDERKHNVNINVNVSLYGNTQKRRKSGTQDFVGVKKQRTTTSSEFISKLQTLSPDLRKNNSFFATKPNDPESYAPEVDDELAALFPESSSSPAMRKHCVDNNSKAHHGRRVLCVVCHGKERDALFKPCNHCCACMNCALKLRICPMCRAPVDATSHIFLS